MQYIKKPIEIKTSGHINECWIIDYVNYPVTIIGHDRTATLVGYKTYQDMIDGKKHSDSRSITVLGSDVGALTGVDIQDIPNFYTVLTTKTNEETYFENEIATEAGVNTSGPIITPYEAGDLIRVEKTRQVPAFPDFFGGEIIDVV